MIIEENKDKLANYFKASEIVLTLVERGALTFQDKYLILNENTVYKSNMSLLDIITKKGPNSCSKFAVVLQEQSSDKTVYELFEEEYVGGGWIGNYGSYFFLPLQCFDYLDVKPGVSVIVQCYTSMILIIASIRPKSRGHFKDKADTAFKCFDLSLRSALETTFSRGIKGLQNLIN